MAIKLNGASDTYWSIVNDRAETIYHLAAMMAEQNARHYAVRQLCSHVANHAQAIVDLNQSHLRGYNGAADDNIGVMCDRIGLILRDEALVRGIPEAHITIMRAGVSAIRSALFARQGQQRRETEAARFEPQQRKVMAA